MWEVCLVKVLHMIALIYICGLNLAAFTICGIDKWKAVHQRWRISERCLMLLAAVGGSIGMLAGMYFFRHKTRHPKFYLGVPAILICQIIIVVVVVLLR